MITDANDEDDRSSEMYCPFDLPHDEYGDMMFERRLAMEDSLSPVASRTSRAAESRRGSTVADTDGEHKHTSRTTAFGHTLTLAHPRTAIFSCSISGPQLQSKRPPLYKRHTLHPFAS